MKRNHILFRCSSLLMALVLTGCTVSSPGDGKRRTDIQERQQGQDVPEPVHGIGFDPEINPESFSIYLHTENGTVQVNAADKKRTVEQYKTDGDRITWEYPGDEESERIHHFPDSSGQRVFMARGFGRQLLPSLWRGQTGSGG